MVAALMPEGKQSFTNSAGVPLVGGKVYTYDAGTSIPRATYQDAAGTVPNTNPVILDARGEATIFWDGVYKVILKDAADALIWTVDGATTPEAAGSAAQLRADLASSSVGFGSKIVRFIQRVGGAVARWVEDKLSDTLSVKDFGAVGDGTVDDTMAVQTAINAALALNTTCYFPPGTYKITAALTIAPTSGYGVGCVLQGMGMGSVIKAVGFTGDVLTCNASTPAFQGTQVVIRGLRFFYSGATPNSYIYNQEGINLVIEDCAFITVAATTACVNNAHGYGLSLKNCIFSGVIGDGVYLQQNVNESIRYSFVVSFDNCDFSTISGKAINAQGSNVLMLQDTVIQQCNYGLYVDPVTPGTVAFNIRIVSCWFEKNTTSDIELLSNTSSWCEAKIEHCQFGGFSPTFKAHINLGARSRIFVTGTPTGNVVEVAGSASAAFYGIGTTPRFIKVGTFFWVEYDYAGGFNTPYINTDSSGNIIANVGAFITANGSVSLSTGVAATLFTMPAATDAVYVLSTHAGVSGPGNWTAVALVSCSASIGRVTVLQTATNLTLTAAGLAIQGTQATGGSVTVAWAATRIK